MRNKLLEKYPIELKIDPLKGAQLTVQVETKEEADQIIKNLKSRQDQEVLEQWT